MIIPRHIDALIPSCPLFFALDKLSHRVLSCPTQQCAYSPYSSHSLEGKIRLHIFISVDSATNTIARKTFIPTHNCTYTHSIIVAPSIRLVWINSFCYTGGWSMITIRGRITFFSRKFKVCSMIFLRIVWLNIFYFLCQGANFIWNNTTYSKLKSSKIVSESITFSLKFVQKSRNTSKILPISTPIAFSFYYSFKRFVCLYRTDTHVQPNQLTQLILCCSVLCCVNHTIAAIRSQTHSLTNRFVCMRVCRVNMRKKRKRNKRNETLRYCCCCMRLFFFFFFSTVVEFESFSSYVCDVLCSTWFFSIKWTFLNITQNRFLVCLF